MSASEVLSSLLGEGLIVRVVAVQTARSFFGRVSRYTGGGTDQRENRLTEALAAVLVEVPELAYRLARAWLDESPVKALGETAGEPDVAYREDELRGESPQVDTQWFIPGRGIPDLRLKFSTESGESLVVAVEVKRDASLTYNKDGESQLERYLGSDLIDAVVLLAPRDYLLGAEKGSIPDEVAARSWESAGVTIEGAIDDLEGTQRWLAEQLVLYLREEGLMAPHSIEPKHFGALAWNRDAKSGLAELLRRAEALVEPWDRGENTNYLKSVYGTYIHWELPEPLRSKWPGAWLELKASNEPADISFDDENPDGQQLLFLAGLSAMDEETIRSFGKQLPEVEPGVRLHEFKEDGVHRLMIVTTPDDVLIGETIEVQAEELAQWVTAAFEAITSAQA